jgi:hypothetical protein
MCQAENTHKQARFLACFLGTYLALSSWMAKKKNPHAVALGRLGGLKGGKARVSKLTPQERQELARKAVRARWAKYKKDQQKAD